MMDDLKRKGKALLGSGSEREAQERDEQDTRAVSPVIGVILMVAITVILAAVIGTFVLDLGQNVGKTGPTASLQIQDAGADFVQDDNVSDDMIEITHQGGDQLEGKNLKLIVRNKSTNQLISQWDAGTTTNGTDVDAANWTLNSDNINSDQSITYQTGDVITLAVKDAAGGGTGEIWATDGTDYRVIILDTNTDNRVAASTVTVN